ncbi:MAG: hypothetical protein AAB354_10785 [candidate division KSB1 bacterium]
MNHQLADKFLKDLVEHHLKEFLALLDPKRKYEVISTPLDKELIVRRRESDFVVKVRVGRRIFLFHFEFLSQYRRRNVREAHGYGGALTLKYRCEVVTVLFVLKPPSRNPQALGDYEVAPFGFALNRHQLAVVKLWELREAILAGQKEYLALVPLLAEISPTVDQQLLQRQRELLAQVPDPKRRAELKFYTMAFAQKYFSTKFLMHFFEDKNMNEHWDQVPIFGEHVKRRAKESWQKGREVGIEEGIEEGIEKGIEKGLEKGLNVARHNITAVLRMRFGNVNGQFERALNAIEEPRKLEAVFNRILNADSLAAVQKILAAEKHLSQKAHARRKRQGN